MPERDPKKTNPMNAVSVTNWALLKLGKGVGTAAKAGFEAYKTHRDAKVEKASVEEMHSIMFPGTRPMPGHPLPPFRRMPLSQDELSRFTHAANALIDMGVPLPSYVTTFASNFFIPLKRP